MLGSLDALKTLLGITSTTQDTLLEQLLAAASESIKRYTHRDLEAGLYTEYQDGNGCRDLILRQRPVTSIASLWEDPKGAYGDAPGAFPSSTLLTAGVDYVLVRDGPGGRSDCGLIRKLRPTGLTWWPVAFGGMQGGTLFGGSLGPGWSRGIGSVKISYAAGFSSIPDDLSEACNQLAAWLKRSSPLGGVALSSENLGRYGYASSAQVAYSGLSSAAELGSTRELLAPYREVIL